MAKEWDYERLEGWLEGHPRDVAVAIAVRSALRVQPRLVTVFQTSLVEERQSSLIFSALRCNLTSSVAAVGPTDEVAIQDAAALAAALADAAARAADAAARAAALADALAAALAAARAADAAARAAALAAARADAAAAFWNATGTDAEAVENGASVSDLMQAPLWADTNPPPFAKETAALAEWCEKTPGLSFWPRWYAAMEAGEPMDWAMQEEIALIPDNVWQAGPEAVGAAIAEIEARYAGTASARSVNEGEAIGSEAVAQQMAVNRDALAFTLSALLEDIAAFRETVRCSNSMDPEVRDQFLAFLDDLTGRLGGILRALPTEKEPVGIEDAEEVASWLGRYKVRVLGKFREYSTPENVGDATVPISIILGCTGVGTLLGVPIAGSIAGGLITGQLKPGQAADKLLKPPTPD